MMRVAGFNFWLLLKQCKDIVNVICACTCVVVWMCMHVRAEFSCCLFVFVVVIVVVWLFFTISGCLITNSKCSTHV